jgi:septal ring factor EnvC (AmiA/AmiB activator)
MSELDELRDQLAAMAARVDHADGLRAMMDRDLADIKQRMDAHDLLLQALHVTQSNHTQRLTRIEDALGRVESEFRGKLDLLIAMLGRLAPPEGGS